MDDEFERRLRDDLNHSAGSAGFAADDRAQVLRRSRWRRARNVLAGGAVVFMVASSAVIASSTLRSSDDNRPLETPPGSLYPPQDCPLPRDQGIPVPSEPSGDVAKYELWLMNPKAQVAVDRLGSEYEALFGPDETALQNGFIGTAADHTTQTLFVVVDPDLVTIPDLQSRLQAIVDDAAGTMAFDVKVVASCHPVSALLAAKDVILRRSWHPDAQSVTFSASLDAHNSAWRITLDVADPHARAVGSALEEKLGDLVTVDYAEVEPGTA